MTVLPGSDILREAEARSDAFLLGWHAGYDAGVAAAEHDMAEAWMAEVHRVRALARPDNYMARVATAERFCRAQADRLWLEPAAWESAARHGVSEGARRNGVAPLFPDGDTLARAMGVRLPAGNTLIRWARMAGREVEDVSAEIDR